MGEMADLFNDFSQEYFDGYYEDEVESVDAAYEASKAKRLYKQGKLKWVSKDGSKTFIQNMRNGHALNCLNLLSRRRKATTDAAAHIIYDAFIEIFKQELTKRGEALREKKKSQGDYNLF
jgi:hypothetical protein